MDINDSAGTVNEAIGDIRLDYIGWFIRNIDELTRRYETLFDLLQRAAAGTEIDPLDIEMARRDLMTMLCLASPEVMEMPFEAELAEVAA